MTTPAATAVPIPARDFLFGEGAPRLEERLSESGALNEVRDRLGAVGEGVWSGATGQVASIASDFLTLDLASVVVAGLKKHGELVQAAQATRGTSEVAVVPLGIRDICLTQSPSIDVDLGNVTVAVIRFELSVTATIVGVAGVVRGGALVALQGGRCELSVSFGAAGCRIAERSATLDPHCAIPLGGGVPLTLPRQRA